MTSQFDTRFGRADCFVGTLDRLPATPTLAGWDAGLDQNNKLSQTFSAAIGHAELRRVVLVDNDQYYRDLLTEELLNQGFAVHPFRDGDALLGSLDIAANADLAVLGLAADVGHQAARAVAAP